MNKSPELIAAFHRKLHDWYRAYGRHDLPWRTTSDPYRIYISEIMLQQTQVKTVLERFYFPFLERFPSLKSLAEAELSDVLEVWQGLGYYTRAANLHKAARLASPTLPSDVEALRALPGIGRNTAHAVAAFAHHAPVPVMEANVKRILCRIFALREAKEDVLWEKAALLLDRENPFDYNQAMMDIGALVCTAKNPACALCPAAGLCQGKTDPHAYPAKKPKKTTPVRERAIILFRNRDGKYHITPRATRFLHGLYGFVETEANAHAARCEGKDYPLSEATLIGQIRQVYSHFVLEAKIYLLPLSHANQASAAWKTREEILALPLSGAEQKILRLLE